jgi:signal peptidase I
MVGEARLHAINSEGSMKRYVSRHFWDRPAPLAILGAIAVLILICACGATYLGATIADFRAHTFKVTGPAMDPTIHEGQVLTTQDYGKTNPHRFDIVVFHPPIDPSTQYVERIIGLPGEVVEVREMAVIINGKPLAESYLAPYYGGNYGARYRDSKNEHLTLQKDQYYLLGDNREVSIDSRNFGAVSRSAIMAQVVAIT